MLLIPLCPKIFTLRVLDLSIVIGAEVDFLSGPIWFWSIYVKIVVFYNAYYPTFCIEW